MVLDTNNHSVFLLHYHLIMCVKYRNNVIDDEINEFLKNVFVKIQDRYSIKLEEFNHDKDHVHILFKAETERNNLIESKNRSDASVIE